MRAPLLPIVAVHGFMYDPANVGGPNDPRPWFDEMSAITGRPVVGFAWYSCPVGFRLAHPILSVLQSVRAFGAAWLRGKLHPYRDAWSRAEAEADKLAALIRAQPGRVDLVAHSLGTRVALLALPKVRHKVRRVVFFNGAELARNAEPRASAAFPVWFLNVVVATDQVLGILGSRFTGEANGPCIGKVGLGLGLAPAPINWRDLDLCDSVVVARARQLRGWTLRGDDPGSVWDHGESYRFAGNVDPVRAFLDGDDLDDLVRARRVPLTAALDAANDRAGSAAA